MSRVLAALPMLLSLAACASPPSSTAGNAERPKPEPQPMTRSGHHPPPAPAVKNAADADAASTSTSDGKPAQRDLDLSALTPAIPPYEKVPNSLISMPRQVRAGQTLSGQIPAGSRLRIDGRNIAVGADGRFNHQVPATASGSMAVRIEPTDGRPPMNLKVSISP
ncbi:MAG: hypothetical protein Q4G62_06500 [Pseudomonadota bacterium]|nr:hypothetical protein [Pseudomonadota bacterium]